MLRPVIALGAIMLVSCAESGDTAQDGVSDAAAGSVAARPAPAISEDSIAAAKSVDALQVYALPCGEIDVADLTDYGYPGETDLLTPTCWLVRHPKGDLIWQLGLPGVLAGGPGMDSPPLSLYLEKTLTDQLAGLGLTTDQIDHVAISHSVFHNIGQADQFPGATWLVSESEFRRMFPTVEEGEAEVENGANAAFLAMKRQLLSGPHDVFADGSVQLVPAPGPTPGHMMLQVALPETGTIFLAGGLYHRSEAQADQRVPGFHTDPEQSRASMENLRTRALAEGGRVIIETEPDVIDQLPKPPLALR